MRADLVMLLTRGRWSSSCSDPIPQREPGARPPRNSTGLSFWWAAATAEMALVTPGPAVSAATPQRRVILAQPSAANPAVCSWRTSTMGSPWRRAPR